MERGLDRSNAPTNDTRKAAQPITHGNFRRLTAGALGMAETGLADPTGATAVPPRLSCETEGLPVNLGGLAEPVCACLTGARCGRGRATPRNTGQSAALPNSASSGPQTSTDASNSPASNRRRKLDSAATSTEPLAVPLQAPKSFRRGEDCNAIPLAVCLQREALSFSIRCRARKSLIALCAFRTRRWTPLAACFARHPVGTISPRQTNRHRPAHRTLEVDSLAAAPPQEPSLNQRGFGKLAHRGVNNWVVGCSTS